HQPVADGPGQARRQAADIMTHTVDEPAARIFPMLVPGRLRPSRRATSAGERTMERGSIDRFASDLRHHRHLGAGLAAEAAGLVSPVDPVPARASAGAFLARAPRPVTVLSWTSASGRARTAWPG